MKKVTIICPYYNQDDRVLDTIESIFETANPEEFDLLLINDGSDKDRTPVELQIHDLNQLNKLIHVGTKEHLKIYIKNIYQITREKQYGVGAGFDLGVSHITTPYAILIGSDVRFQTNSNWLHKMIAECEEDPKSIFCTTSVGLSEKTEKIDPNDPKLPRRYAADILLYMYPDDLPPDSVLQNPGFRNIIDAKWRKAEEPKVYEVPCLLGACYIAQTKRYNQLHGFRGHRIWGGLEPMISFKYWLSGGSCKIIKDVEVGHLTTPKGVVPAHATPAWVVTANKLFTIDTMFPEKEVRQMMNHLGRWNETRIVASTVLKEIQNEILTERANNELHFVRDLNWWKERWPYQTNEPYLKDKYNDSNNIIFPED